MNQCINSVLIIVGTHIICMTTKFCLYIGSLPLELHLSVAGAGQHALQIQVTDILDLQDQSNIEYSVYRYIQYHRSRKLRSQFVYV